jgi:hypothetical protein
MEDNNILSEKVPAGKRTYFIDLKENQKGDKLIKITESRKNEGEFIRHTIVIYQEDFDKLFEALDKVRDKIKTL